MWPWAQQQQHTANLAAIKWSDNSVVFEREREKKGTNVYSYGVTARKVKTRRQLVISRAQSEILIGEPLKVRVIVKTSKHSPHKKEWVKKSKVTGKEKQNRRKKERRERERRRDEAVKEQITKTRKLISKILANQRSSPQQTANRHQPTTSPCG